MRNTRVVVPRPWTEAKAKTAVTKFLRGRSSARVSEIVEALGMEPGLAFRTVESLAKEGKIE